MLVKPLQTRDIAWSRALSHSRDQVFLRQHLPHFA
jgi:hypothetical protein